VWFSLLAAITAATIAWPPNPVPVAGYKLYSGSAPGAYTNVVDTGTNRTAVIQGPGAFAVTAYLANGIESDFSAPLIIGSVAIFADIEASSDVATNWTPVATVAVTNVAVGQAFYRAHMRVVQQ